MVTAVVAACAVLAACGLAVVAVHRSRRDAERRLELVLDHLDGHLDAISTSVEQAVARIVDAQRERAQPLTLDFDALVEALVSEAALRTSADTVVLRVEGPGGRPVIASLGPHADDGLLEQTLGPGDSRPFRAATIDWTYGAAGDATDVRFRSALVAPLEPVARIPGTLVAYSYASNAFRPEHASVLHELLAEMATGLTNARRFADVEARLQLDPETGVANRRGYALELEREVARAHRTGRPLSVVLVGLGNGGETATTGGDTSVDQVARLLTRVTRRSDISCQRGDREFAILLPETKEAGATVLTNRLREEAKRALGARRSTIAVGHVEWQPDESAEELEARADVALDLADRPFASERQDWARRARDGRADRTASAAGSRVDRRDAAEALRRDVVEELAHEVLDAHRFGRSLAVVVLEVAGLDELLEREGRERADATLAEMARRLSESVGSGSVHRLGAAEFSFVLSGATADDAEALLDSLQASGGQAGPEIALSAGVTELVERDGAQTLLARAEHALWQARQAGPGSVVVAVPGRRPPRLE